MTSHPQAGVHFRDAFEHWHLTDMHFILHPLLISYMHLGLLASTSIFLVHMYLLTSQLCELFHFLDSLLHGMLEAISYRLVVRFFDNLNAKWIGTNISRSRFTFTKRRSLALPIPLAPFF